MKLDFETDYSDPDVIDTVEHSSDTSRISRKLAAGIRAARNGDAAEARVLLLEVSQAEPENEDAWLWLASISRFPDELLSFLNNVLNVNPGNRRALQWSAATKSVMSGSLVRRGIEAVDDNQNNFARQCFLQAIAHEKENEPAWLWLASVSHEVKEKKQYLEKVSMINPENETALNLAATIRKQIAEARLTDAVGKADAGERRANPAALEDMLAQTPEPADALLLKSFFAPSLDEKIECLEKILEFDAGNDLARNNRAFLRSLKAKLIDEPKTAEFISSADWSV